MIAQGSARAIFSRILKSEAEREDDAVTDDGVQNGEKNQKNQSELDGINPSLPASRHARVADFSKARNPGAHDWFKQAGGVAGQLPFFVLTVELKCSGIECSKLLR